MMDFKTAQRLHMAAVVIMLLLILRADVRNIDDDVAQFIWTFIQSWTNNDVVVKVKDRLSRWIYYPTTLCARYFKMHMLGTRS